MNPTIIATRPTPGARSLKEPRRQRRDAQAERGDAEHLREQRMRRDRGRQRTRRTGSAVEDDKP